MNHHLDDDVRTFLERLGWRWAPCGSRVTCDPPPLDTDRDWLVWRVDATEREVAELMCALPPGLMREGGEHYQVQVCGDFMSLRRGDLNLIVSSSAHFVERHMVATEICRSLNIMSKAARIVVFQRELYGHGEDHPVTRLAIERLSTKSDELRHRTPTQW